MSTVASRNTLEQAVRALAGVCDWADKLDGAGYNSTDAPFGHRLAALPDEDWTPAMRRNAWLMLSKYRAQLARYGVLYEKIAEPPQVDDRALSDARQDARRALRRRENGAPSPGWMCVLEDDEDGGQVFRIRFPYDPNMVAECRSIPGRRYDGTTKSNTVPVHPLSARALLRFLDRWKLDVHPDAREALSALLAEPEPETETVEEGVDCNEEGTEFRVTFEFDERLVNSLKARIPTREWDRMKKWWKIRAEPVASSALVQWAEEVGLDISARARGLIDRLSGEMDARLEASTAAEADLELPGFGLEPYPFQKAGILYAQRVKRCLIADDMGLGKTIQALGVIFLENLYPAVIICPAVVKYNWAKEAKRCLPGKRILAADSSTTPAELSWADVIITNYDVLKVQLDDPKKPRGKYHAVGLLQRLIERNAKIIVFDEFHYCKNAKTQRAKAAMLLVKGKEWRIGLTGTPFTNRPNEGISQLKILGRLADLGGYQQYTNRYCAASNGRYGVDTSGHGNLIELNQRLRATCMIRRLKKDVLKELPAKQRSIVPVELSNRAEYSRAERDLIAWLMQTASAEVRDAKVAAAMRAEQLVRISALKQLAAKGKLEWAKTWVRDFLESGEKLILFGWHREIVETLAREFKAPKITGDTSLMDRQRIVERFQTDENTRLVCCNIKAAAVGITLTAASNVAFLELGWTPADHQQAEDRAHRIGQTADSVNAWYLLGVKTIDEKIYELLDEKAKVTSAAADGVEVDMGAAVLNDLVNFYRGGVNG